MTRVAMCLVLALGLGCKKRSTKAAADPPPAAAADAAAEAPRRPPPIRRAAAKGVIDAWLAAQNRGDFAAYAALYAADFHGVRRSGTKTVRLDRAGWLADRKRMFKKPMKVAASNLEIAIGPKGARVELVQDWASGSYHDVGPKVLRLERSGKELRIRSEEMLSSMLLGPPADLPVASERFALVYGGKLVLADDASSIHSDQPARMLRGSLEVPDRDPSCDSDPPDYERDQERYWECENSRADNQTDHFIAEQAVPAAALGKELAGWLGKKVTLYDGHGARCDVTVGDPILWGEWETSVAEIAAAGGGAKAVLARGGPVLLAHLPGACGGVAYARAKRLGTPPVWKLTPARGALEAATRQALSKLAEYEDIFAASGAPITDLIELVPPPGGQRVVVGVRDGLVSCQEHGALIGVFKVSGEASGPKLEVVYEGIHESGKIAAAADLTGDGMPEIVLPDGYLIWRDGAYSRLSIIDFPDEVPDCECECE